VLFGAVAGWGLWFWLIARCSMTRLAPFGLLQIVFAVAAGVIFLNERLTPMLVTGAAICIIGVAISQIRSAVVASPQAGLTEQLQRNVPKWGKAVKDSGAVAE
jgi:drug/metabolite transporter (DMT)-like permease